MFELERVLKEYEEYLKKAESAFIEKDWEKSVGYATLAIELLHSIIPKLPPELARIKLDQVDTLLKFIENIRENQKISNKQCDDINDECKNANPWLLREVPKIKDEDLIGMDQLKKELNLFIVKAKHPEIVAKWKGARKGNRMILWGPPGTGKTFFAKYVASKIDAAFYQVKASNLLSKWVGESQKNVVRLFESIEKDERAVLFIDEIDAVLGKRGSNSTVRDGVVTEFLQCMDGLTTCDRALFFIGATNRPFDLDEAAISRFGMLVYIPLPNFEARLIFIRKILDELPYGYDSEKISPESIAQELEGHSMRDLQKLRENIADIGIKKESEHKSGLITYDDLREAISKIAPPLSKQEIQKYQDMAEYFNRI